MGVDDLIDFNKIKQNKVRELLKKNGLYSLSDLSKLRSICFDPDDGYRYHKHTKTFLIEAEIDRVWQTYKSIKPEETWNGEMVSFGCMYSRKSNTISFPGDDYTGLEAGQILFMNLNLFNNLVHLAVGHEVTGINEEEKSIRICYLQNGASTGTQKIQLIELGKQTQVVHDTWYRSGSIIRDKILYPLFHAKAISEFHNNVKRKVEAN
jgi:hypothetical protein